MSLWVAISIFAAFMQNLRFMLQKHLKSTQLSTGGATFSRFLFSAPLAALLVFLYARVTNQALPSFSGTFYLYAMWGGVSQIVATAFVVALFAQRNFTVGIALKKTEVILTALVGLIVLGERISAWGLLAIALGFVGVIFLSDPPEREVGTPWKNRLFNVASGYGLASGLFFGFSAIGYRGASLELASSDFLLRAMATLAFVTAFQVVVMLIWLRLRDAGEIGRVIASWRVSSLVGVTSMLGSLGWFAAFTLQNAAYVKAVGQIELVFTFLASYFVFKEKSSGREVLGILLLVASILVLVLTY